jgi:HTH DNA binding domain
MFESREASIACGIRALPMRRVVLVLSGKEFEKSLKGSMLENLESFEILYAYKVAPSELAAIVRIELKEPYERLEDLPMKDIRKIAVEPLKREDGGAQIYFIHMKAKGPYNLLKPDPIGVLPYITTPFEFRKGELRLTFIGTSKQLKRLLNLERNPQFRHKVVSLTDARFRLDSPVAGLTEMQRKVLITAFRLGYYDVPRRVSSLELAKRLNLAKSTFSTHVRKAEGRVLREVLGAS